MTKPSKTQRKLNSLGQMMASVSEFQDIRTEVADHLKHGGTEDDARALAISRGRKLNLLGPRVFIPALTRKIMRRPLSKVLHELADWLDEHAKGKRLGDVAEDLYSRIGADDWFADFIVEWARDPDGEPGEFFPQMGGRVWSQKIGTAEGTTDTVMVLITPMSDPHELLKQAYEECHRVLPEGTWSRYGANVEAHRFLRLKLQEPGRTWGDVAEIVLDEREPHLRDQEKKDFAVAKRMERKKIEKLMSRFTKEYADSFFTELSADSE